MATVPKSDRITIITLASAIAGPFDLTFRLFDDDALAVFVNDLPRTDFTISSNYVDGYDDDATITFDSALSISDVIRIYGDLTPARADDFPNGPGLTEKLNIEFGRLWASVSEIKRDTNHSLKTFNNVPPTDPVDGKAIIWSEAAGRFIYASVGEADIAIDVAAAQAARAGAETARGLADADVVQTGLDRAATGADVVQTGLDLAATNAVLAQTVTVRDAAEDAVQYDYLVDDDAALALLTGMVLDDRAYVRDTEHVWRYDGAVWVDGGLAVTAQKADKTDLYAISQPIGPANVDLTAGAGTLSSNFFVYANPVEDADGRLQFTCYAGGAGTVRVALCSKSGDIFTVEQIEDLTVAIGLNTFATTLSPQAGWHVGFAVSSGIMARDVAADPSSGGWYNTTSLGTDPLAGETFTDTEAGNVTRIMARFDVEVKFAKGSVVKYATDEIDLLSSAVGLDAPTIDQTVARDAGTLVTGSTIGSGYYVFEGAADSDRIVTDFSVYGVGPGNVTLSTWSTVDGFSTQERLVTLSILNSNVSGVNEFQNVGLLVKKGEKVAINKGTGSVAFNVDGVTPTPYRQITATSGILGPVISSNRIEVSVTLAPYNLDTRVEVLEAAGDDAFTFETFTFHAVWMLGESHAAGRGLTLSPSIIPADKGYVYRRATTSIVSLVDPTGNDSTAISGVGRGSWGPAVGRLLLEATSGAIGGAIVNSGEGGTRITTEWASGGASWTQAQTDWTTAKAAMDTLNKSLCGVSVMIAIGSNDAGAGTTKAAFKAGVIDLIDRVRVLLGYDVPILILPTGPFDDGTSATAVAYIQDAQHEIAKEVANVRIVTTATEYAADNGWFIDNVHFNQSANEIIGSATGATAVAVGTGNSAR